MQRREFIALLAMAAAARRAPAAGPAPAPLRQGVTWQVFGDLPLEDCCRMATKLGVQGFDFIGNPADWQTVRRHGMTMTMYRLDFGGGISKGRSPTGPPGWNAIGRKEAQGEYLAALRDGIRLAAREGFPNVFVAAGTRVGLTNSEGADNAVAFLDAVKGLAEELGVTVCMELLNSKGLQAPKDSLFDHAEWGFDVCRRVGSPRVKVLYDIWHAQLMEGNIVATIRQNIGLIGHIHAGSVPDRNELFRNDELDYRTIASVIAGLGYSGYITHEWSPSAGSDVEDDLRRSVALLRG
jgi:hydroxypyruvate isomerase